MRRFLLGCFLALLFPVSGRAQVPAFFDPPPMDKRRAIEAVRLATPPEIDGDVTDAVWATITPSAGFVQFEPHQGEKPLHHSEVKFAYDDTAFYVAAKLEQPGGWTAFNQRDLRRDFPTNECDQFSLILDTLGDGRNAFVFAVNPFGAQRDVQIVDDDLVEPNWDTLWRAATKRDDQGWTVELAIPWKSVRYGAPGTTWGIQFFRRERGINQDVVWSPVPRNASPSRMPYAGVIKNFDPPKASLLSVQLRPYLIGRLEKVGDDPITVRPNGGGEITWSPTSNQVVDLTGNTDFAETDVDRRVVNLSRFSVFFPERRQFFLESAGVFQAGFQGFLQPFFSRQIGLSDGKSVPITAGARWVYRTVEQSAGALAVHTLPTADTNSSLFALARYSRNVGEQSRLGGMVVFRNDFEGPGGENTTNVLPVIDGFARAGPVTFAASLMGSTTTTKSTGTKFGGAGTIEARLQGNWGNLNAWGVGITPDFEARTGFVARGDIMGFGINGGLDLRPDWLPDFIRNFGPFVDGFALWGVSTQKFQESNVYFSPMWMQLSGGDEIWLFVEHSDQVLTEAFTPVNNTEFKPGAYSYERMGASYAGQQSRKFFAGFDVSGGSYYSASAFNVNARASVQPIPHVSFGATYSYNHFWGAGVLKDFTNTHLLLLETRLALTPKLQLIGSYQRDTDGNVSVLNARLAWEFLPLSFIYVVVTDTRNAFSAPDTPAAEFRVVAKATYTWRL
ncbi:MAG: DUF5916 domain-containing protein [Archangium sp.]